MFDFFFFYYYYIVYKIWNLFLMEIVSRIFANFGLEIYEIVSVNFIVKSCVQILYIYIIYCHVYVYWATYILQRDMVANVYWLYFICFYSK
jgi:hypothetical protein